MSAHHFFDARSRPPAQNLDLRDGMGRPDLLKQNSKKCVLQQEFIRIHVFLLFSLEAVCFNDQKKSSSLYPCVFGIMLTILLRPCCLFKDPFSVYSDPKTKSQMKLTNGKIYLKIVILHISMAVPHRFQWFVFRDVASQHRKGLGFTGCTGHSAPSTKAIHTRYFPGMVLLKLVWRHRLWLTKL